ncbi:hypothetical protein [Bradyrhizobium sp. S3.2.6]|uniref:hypothetical protein n=1 Tax=Bradyrhizobium sp. S3.2.6 TaxID=3156428 RepID=UPI0033988932
MTSPDQKPGIACPSRATNMMPRSIAEPSRTRRQNAERQSDQQRDRKAGQAKRQSDWQSVADQSPYRDVVEEGSAEIALGGVAGPIEKLHH